MEGWVVCKVLLLAAAVSLNSGKPVAPKKVAILGGGAASCTAALALTGQPGWKERYDITIYQLGWRLGGKTTSGRNRQYGQRIEEITDHGIAGIYHNTKRLLKSVYKELNRPEGSPMRTFEDAFKLVGMFSLKPLNISMDDEENCFSIHYILNKIIRKAWKTVEDLCGNMKTHPPDFKISDDLVENHITIHLMKQWVIEKEMEVQDSMLQRGLLLYIDISITVFKGIMDDNVLKNGLDCLNHMDFREWLAKHGLTKTALESYMLQFHYDFIISYIDGDINFPSMETGTFLKYSLQTYFCHDDVPDFEEQGGLGDLIFAPMYEVLKTRGVSFKFFHKVENLHLNENNPSIIEKIRITKQVDLINGQYNPLINVKGLPSWPNQPKYEEIKPEQAQLLQEHDIDLENVWTPWSHIFEENMKSPLPHFVLERGRDFDIIVSGIPIDSINHIGSELLEVSPALIETVQHIGRIPSLQVQLYLDVLREKISHKYNDYNILLDHDKSVFMWATNDDNLMLEDWESSGADPKTCQHVLFMMSTQEQNKNCEKNNKNFIISKLQDIFKNHWPYAYKDGHFNWNLLTDPENRTGVERFDAQFWQCNLNPSDLYTQILTNTSQYRITTDGAGFDNIYFTGDWIHNGLNIGSIEGAVTSGLLTSKMMTGYPEKIFWENYIKT